MKKKTLSIDFSNPTGTSILLIDCKLGNFLTIAISGFNEPFKNIDTFIV